ncbi:MAG: RNA methyltransferase [Actinobacteria bacterium]|nr:RNA methyltransferase [Actinomycetota bacterium]
MLVIEGVRGVAAAFDAGAAVEQMLVEPDAPADLVRQAVACGADVVTVTPGVVERLSDTMTPQGVIAVARAPDRVLTTLSDLSLAVVLADVRDPGNAGTIVRAAEGAGASAVIFCRGSADAFAPKVVRAAAGAIFHVPVVRGDHPGEVLDVLAERGVRRLGTVAEGGEPYDHVDWSVPSALVLGNEAWGVPTDAARGVDAWVTIPLHGRSESINVAMAASVLLFEASRHARGGT